MSTTSASIVALDPSAVEANERMLQSMMEERAKKKVTVDFKLETFCGVSLTVPFSLEVVMASSCDVTECRAAIEATIADVWRVVDECLNEFNEDSEVSALNRLGAEEEATVSSPLCDVLSCAFEVHGTTGGLFDPTFGTTRSLLLGETCNPSALSTAWRFDATSRSIQRMTPGGDLSLGGISKGWAVDAIIDELRKLDFVHGALMDWGGEVKVLGSPKHLAERAWTVGVVKPPSLEMLKKMSTPVVDRSSLIHVLHLEDGDAVATSGDYENVRSANDSGVCTNIVHVPAKKFLYASLDSIAQVTVVARSCMHADALATATLIAGTPQKARDMLLKWEWAPECRVMDYTLYQRAGSVVSVMPTMKMEAKAAKEQRVANATIGVKKSRVVVVGGGLAGLSAAIEAVRSGASVVLCEKASILGGNSAKATTGLNAFSTRAQLDQRIGKGDSSDLFSKDVEASAKGGHYDPALIRTLATHCTDAVDWLDTESGVPLTKVSHLGGHAHPRTHRVPDKDARTPVPVGFTIMSSLVQAVTASPEFKDALQVKLNSEVTAIRQGTPDGYGHLQSTVAGVSMNDNTTDEETELPCDAVILTTGGFGHDHNPSNSLLREFTPNLKDFPTTHAPSTTGDGVKIGRAVGGRLVDMEKVLVHPIGFIDPKEPETRTKYLGPEALRVSGFVLIQPGTGKRFCNEIDRLDNISNAINDNNAIYPGSPNTRYAFCLLGPDGIDLFGASLTFYRDKAGLFQLAETLEDLAALMSCPKDQLQTTLQEYDQAVEEGKCHQTGKTQFPCTIGTTGPFVVAAVSPCIHYNMGGLLINAAAEVQRHPLPTQRDNFLGDNHHPVHGLFAAGEVSAGLHGKLRVGGNTLLESVVFGRIAGERAATITQRTSHALQEKEWTWLTVREVRNEQSGQGCGAGSVVLMLNLPGALQITGLELGEFVSVRATWDGRRVIGYYSPITVPDEVGVVGLLARSDKGNLSEWIQSLRPGDPVEVCKAGGLVMRADRTSRTLSVPPNTVTNESVTGIKKIGLIAGGTGLAPMIQLLQAATMHPHLSSIDTISLVYAAETQEELSFTKELEQLAAEKQTVHLHCVLHHPPAGWEQSSGFVTQSILTKHIPPPSSDTLVVVCGPPPMQAAVQKHLHAIGHAPQLCRTVDEVVCM